MRMEVSFRSRLSSLMFDESACLRTEASLPAPSCTPESKAMSARSLTDRRSLRRTSRYEGSQLDTHQSSQCSARSAAAGISSVGPTARMSCFKRPSCRAPSMTRTAGGVVDRLEATDAVEIDGLFSLEEHVIIRIGRGALHADQDFHAGGAADAHAQPPRTLDRKVPRRKIRTLAANQPVEAPPCPVTTSLRPGRRPSAASGSRPTRDRPARVDRRLPVAAHGRCRAREADNPDWTAPDGTLRKIGPTARSRSRVQPR